MCSGWGWGLSVLAISTVSFMVLDLVKVAITRAWSFELTATLWPSPARRAKLKDRQAKKAVQERVAQNVEKMKKVVKLQQAVSSFRDGLDRTDKDGHRDGTEAINDSQFTVGSRQDSDQSGELDRFRSHDPLFRASVGEA